MTTIRECHDALPGVAVMQYRNGGKNSHGLDFTVRQQSGEQEFPFEAATPYRSCVYAGRNQAEAIGALLLGVAQLSRDGSFDPNAPERSGSPIIQHVIHVLTERLLWQVEQRKRHIQDYGLNHLSQDDVGASGMQTVARDNEIISAIGTSIAALARVKDL